MIAAEDDREFAGTGSLMHRFVERTGDRRDDLQIVGFRMVGQVAGRQRLQVAFVGDAVAETGQNGVETCNAQRCGAHRSTATAGAFFEWRADEHDVLLGLSHGLPRKFA
jgi:hypothetical protein